LLPALGGWRRWRCWWSVVQRSCVPRNLARRGAGSVRSFCIRAGQVLPQGRVPQPPWARQRRDVLLMDNRGTGRSGAIDCQPLQTDPTFTESAVGQCGHSLGAHDSVVSGIVLSPRRCGNGTAELVVSGPEGVTGTVTISWREGVPGAHASVRGRLGSHRLLRRRPRLEKVTTRPALPGVADRGPFASAGCGVSVGGTGATTAVGAGYPPSPLNARLTG
jgi:hypothetical protein